MFIILLGAPGCGKGTAGKRIESAYQIPTVSTGDLLRENIKNGTELGRMAKSIMDDGKLVPDELVIDLLKDRLKKQDCQNGCIFDGFPRTIPQAEKLDELVKIDKVVLIDVDKQIIKDRILSRRTCSGCAKIFNTSTYDKDVCDVCGEKLIIRADDNAEAVEKRFDTYEQQTKPLIKYYQDKELLAVVKGQETPSQTFEAINNVLSELVKYDLCN